MSEYKNIEQAADSWEAGNNLMIFRGNGKTKTELDKEWQDFEANMTPDQQMKSDDESIRLYGKTNLERYKELSGKAPNVENNGSVSEALIYSDYDTNEEKSEDIPMELSTEDLEKIDAAKTYMQDMNTIIMYPTKTIEELEELWQRMNSQIPTDDIIKNDTMAIQLYGMTNIDFYKMWKSKLLDWHYDIERKLNDVEVSNKAKELREACNTSNLNLIIEEYAGLINNSNPINNSTFQEIDTSLFEAKEKITSLVEYTPMASLNPMIGTSPTPMYLAGELDIDDTGFDEELKKKITKYSTIFDSTFRGESIVDLSGLQEEWKADVMFLQKAYNENHNDVTRRAIFALGWHPDYDIGQVDWKTLNEKTLKHVSEHYNYSGSKIIDISEFTKLFNKNDDDKEIKVDRKRNLNPVYVVLVSGIKGSLGVNLIRWWTKGPFCHAALGLDYTLNDMVSFNDAGGEHQGLSKESLNFYTPDERIGVYAIFVNDEDYTTLKNNIQYYLNNKGKTHYSRLNIVSIILQQPLNFQFDMICSQFVDRLLKFINVDITNKDSSLVSPNDFYRAAGFNKRIYKIYDGKIKDYNPKRAKKAVDKLLASDKTQYYKETGDLLEAGAKLLKHKITSTTQKLDGLCGNRIENLGGGKVSGDYHNAILQHGIESDKEDIDEYEKLLGMYKDTDPQAIVEEYNLWLDGEFNRLTKIFAVRDSDELDDLRSYGLDDKHNDPSGINYALCMKEDIDKLARMGYDAKEVKNIIISDYFAKIDNPDDLRKMLTLRLNYNRKMFKLFKVMVQKNYQLLEMADSEVNQILSQFDLGADEKYAAIKQIKSALDKNSKKFEIKPGVYDLRELSAGVICITPKLKNKELHTLSRLIQQALEWDVVVVAHGNTAPNINGIQDYKTELDNIFKTNKKEKRKFFKELERYADENTPASCTYADDIFAVIKRSFDISISSSRNEVIIGDKTNKAELILNDLIEEQPKHIEHIEHVLQKSSVKVLEDLTNEITLECMGSNKSMDEDFNKLLNYIEVNFLIPVVIFQCKVNALNKYLLNYADWIWTTQPVYTLKAGPFKTMNELLRQLVYEENFKKILLYNCNPGGYPIPEDIVKNAHVVIKYGTTFNFSEDATIIDSDYNDILSLYNTNRIEEGYVFSEQDLILNFDKWKKGTNNILYITGLSGSGKTTLGEEYEKKYNAKLFEIDGIEHNYDSTNASILDKAKEKFPIYKKLCETKDGWKDISDPNSEAYGILWKVLNYCISLMKQDSKNLYIVEGIQIFELMEPSTLKSKPLIIKGTSTLKSFIQASHRNKQNGGNPMDGLFDKIKWYLSDSRQLAKFKKEIKK